jgi:hypothetical protein
MKKGLLISLSIFLLLGSLWCTRRGVVYGRGGCAIGRNESPVEYWALLVVSYALSAFAFILRVSTGDLLQSFTRSQFQGMINRSPNQHPPDPTLSAPELDWSSDGCMGGPRSIRAAMGAFGNEKKEG